MKKLRRDCSTLTLPAYDLAVSSLRLPRLFQADERADSGIAADYARDISGLSHVEDDDGQIVVHAKRDRRGIHDFQLLLQHFLIGYAVESGCCTVFHRICGV